MNQHHSNYRCYWNVWCSTLNGTVAYYCLYIAHCSLLIYWYVHRYLMLKCTNTVSAAWCVWTGWLTLQLSLFSLRWPTDWDLTYMSMDLVWNLMLEIKRKDETDNSCNLTLVLLWQKCNVSQNPRLCLEPSFRPTEIVFLLWPNTAKRQANSYSNPRHNASSTMNDSLQLDWSYCSSTTENYFVFLCKYAAF
jgi:hypothetical protein